MIAAIRAALGGSVALSPAAAGLLGDEVARTVVRAQELHDELESCATT